MVEPHTKEPEGASILDRLSALEGYVRRVVEQLRALRQERDRLAEGAAQQDREVATLKARLADVESEKRRLLREREELLEQIEGICKDLEKLGA